MDQLITVNDLFRLVMMMTMLTFYNYVINRLYNKLLLLMSVLQVQRQRILQTDDGDSLAELDGWIYMTINRQPIRVYDTISFE